MVGDFDAQLLVNGVTSEVPFDVGPGTYVSGFPTNQAVALLLPHCV